MGVAVNESEELISARLLDMLSTQPTWHTALWNPGLVLSIREVLEASRGVQESILSESSLAFVVSSVTKNAPRDKGIGSRSLLRALQEALPQKLRFGGLDYLAASQLSDEFEKHYLENWAAYVGSASAVIEPERTARAIASHLLDLGFNSEFLHRWWTYRLKYEQPKRSLSELISECHSLALTAPRAFDALVAFEHLPHPKYGRPDGWMDAPAVSAWLNAQGFSTRNVRQRGGLNLTFIARDSRAAAEAVAHSMESLAARARIATGIEVQYLKQVWIAGESAPHPITAHNNNLRIGALIRENAVYTRPGAEDNIDAAFELLSSLQAGSSMAAVAGGWAAIEALLSEPNDRGGAADRLAAVVACSFPRAELTSLSYKIQSQDPMLGPELNAIIENRDRSLWVADAIVASKSISLTSWSDRAALNRMRSLLHSPAEALQDMQHYLAQAFRRLYRQRNLILHGGLARPVALRSCLRTGMPLVIAGMDRLAHGYYVSKIHPLETAARARISITTAGAKRPQQCVDLLGI